MLVGALAAAVTAGPLSTAPGRGAARASARPSSIGRLLFQRYLLPFELTGLLLLVATIGILMLAKRKVALR